MSMHVFLLEPVASELAALADAFRAASADVEVGHFASVGELERELAAATEAALVVIDAERGDGHASGEDVLADLRQKFPRAPLVLSAATGDVTSARRAVACGATDYLVRGSALVERARTLLGKVRGVVALLEDWVK